MSAWTNNPSIPSFVSDVITPTQTTFLSCNLGHQIALEKLNCWTLVAEVVGSFQEFDGPPLSLYGVTTSIKISWTHCNQGRRFVSCPNYQAYLMLLCNFGVMHSFLKHSIGWFCSRMMAVFTSTGMAHQWRLDQVWWSRDCWKKQRSYRTNLREKGDWRNMPFSLLFFLFLEVVFTAAIFDCRLGMLQLRCCCWLH